MRDFIESFFEAENIDCYSSLAVDTLQNSEIICPRRLPDFAKTCIVILVPYFVNDASPRNLSLYAVSRDYHQYVKELESRFVLSAAQKGIDIRAKFFADTSPFDERALAIRSNLGFAGQNGLLINPVYGSYVFIGELVVDAEISLSSGTTQITNCLSCGKCRKSCPTGCLSGDSVECMSHITQKKQISENEKEQIMNHQLVWGCDICQQVCPHNVKASETRITFFRENRIPHLSTEALEKMSDGEFSLRAYSWRGRNVIARNISLHEKTFTK